MFCSPPAMLAQPAAICWLYGNDLNTQSPSACGNVAGYTIGCLPGGGSVSIPPYETQHPKLQHHLPEGDAGKTRYNSLQIKAETKTPKHGLYALFAYTYSRTYDNGLSDGLGSVLSAPYFPLPNWQNLDWSLSQINLDNSFTGSVIYDLPFGKGRMFGGNWNPATDSILGNWQVTLIERISSGFPVPLIDSNNAGWTGFQLFQQRRQRQQLQPARSARQMRPPGRQPRPAPVDQLRLLRRARPDSQRRERRGELGNAARVPVTGPNFVNSDFSLIKDFALRREMGLNFRAEFFNLFNHPDLGMPINDINSPGFGAVNSNRQQSALDPVGLETHLLRIRPCTCGTATQNNSVAVPKAV